LTGLTWYTEYIKNKSCLSRITISYKVSPPYKSQLSDLHDTAHRHNIEAKNKFWLSYLNCCKLKIYYDGKYKYLVHPVYPVWIFFLYLVFNYNDLFPAEKAIVWVDDS
jgi:hypothetical protein